MTKKTYHTQIARCRFYSPETDINRCLNRDSVVNGSLVPHTDYTQCETYKLVQFVENRGLDNS